MFRKYYKDANNDIKADDAFLNSVINNTHKKRVPSRKSYYRYTMTAAAAVVVISATAVSLPHLINQNDDGIISVSTQTAQPDKNAVTNTPTQPPTQTAAPIPPQKTEVKETEKKATVKKETKTTEKNEEPVFQAVPEQTEIKKETADEVSENGMKTNNAVMYSSMPYEETLKMNADRGETGTPDVKKKDVQDNTESNALLKTPSAAGGCVPAMKDFTVESAAADSVSMSGGTVMPSVSAPSGYQVEIAGYGTNVFSSESGGRIEVTTNYTGNADREPVYSIDEENISASFTANGVDVDIFAVNAEKSAVDEIVNSLR
ncbi:MAG: hypothetical protein HFE52_03240 [Clostridia bacterium]|nr:hypothetical protein [Clostridia bacterium]NDO18314.1 hypothetical protein [Lachnospiraceae bacterium MD329]